MRLRGKRSAAREQKDNMAKEAASPPIILIQGPTGSGKSALALALAERLEALIVNADALQVYADWRVLSARPSVQEEARAPHLLFGHVDAAERYSVGRWLRDAVETLRALQAQDKRVIVVGGTGLYFRALTQGLAEIPDLPEEVSSHITARIETEGTEALHAELRAVDPDSAARISPGDPTRILRALAVFEAFGETITALQARTAPPLPEARFCGLALTPSRASLYEAINARFGAMVEAGALEEARVLLARDLPPELPAMKAVGAPPLFAHLRGDMTLDDAIALGARDTRRYAKRQFTWVSNQIPDWPKLEMRDLDPRLDAALTILAQEGMQ